MKPKIYVRCQNDDCKRLLPEGRLECEHCGTVVLKRRPDPIREALVLLVIRINEIKGDWTESLDTAMQQAERALKAPDHAALIRMAAEPPLTCVQLLEHARDSMDAADAELQAANKLASGMASLLLLDMIREVCTMAARIRAILAAAKDAEEAFNVYCKGDGSWLADASKGVYSMDRGQAVAMTRADAEKHNHGAYHVVPVGEQP